MVIGVKLFTQGHSKEYRCKSCKHTIKQGEEVTYHFAAPTRFYHLNCNWGGVKVAVLKSSPGVRFAGCIPAERHAHIRTVLASHLDEARIDLENKFRTQLEWKRSLLQSHPVGTKLVHLYERGQVRFVEVVGYSLMGNNVRVRQFEMTALDTWTTQQRRFLYTRGFQSETVRQVYVLYQADWEKKTDLYYNVTTADIGCTLINGGDIDAPYDYVPNRLPEVSEASGQRTVNVRTLAGKLIYSVALDDDTGLYGLQLTTRVAYSIGLVSARGIVELMKQHVPIHMADDVAEMFKDLETPLELTAVVRENPRWPVALDGRRLPYAYLQHVPVYNEGLAMAITTEHIMNG